MAMPVNIHSANGKNQALVTEFGQLVVAPLAYSEPVTIELGVINTAFNFLVPVSGKSIVITDFLISANRDVSNTAPADIEIYGADAPDTLVISNGILSPRMIRSTNLPVTGLNMIVPPGQWVNAKTDDDAITITIMYYRIPVE